MFIIKADIKEGKALIIGSHNDTSRITVLKTSRIILSRAQNVSFDQYNEKKKLYIQLLQMD
jgi:hypothetical protein